MQEKSSSGHWTVWVRAHNTAAGSTQTQEIFEPYKVDSAKLNSTKISLSHNI